MATLYSQILPPFRPRLQNNILILPHPHLQLLYPLLLPLPFVLLILGLRLLLPVTDIGFQPFGHHLAKFLLGQSIPQTINEIYIIADF